MVSKGTCTVTGCEKDIRSRKWCHYHYTYYFSKLGIDPETKLPIPGKAQMVAKETSRTAKSKVCSKCGEEKKRKFYYENANGTLYGACKDCHNKQNKAAQQRAAAKKRLEKEPVVLQSELNCYGPECDRSAVTRGLCKAHYGQMHAGKELHPVTRKHDRQVSKVERQCTDCEQVKHVRNFYQRSGGRGYQASCSKCMVDRSGFAIAVKKQDKDRINLILERMCPQLKDKVLNAYGDRL